MTTHRILVTPKLGGKGYRYSMANLDTGEALGIAREPLTSAARILAARGADDADKVEIWRHGRGTFDIRASVGGMKGRTLKDGDAGTWWVKYTPLSLPGAAKDGDEDVSGGAGTLEEVF